MITDAGSQPRDRLPLPRLTAAIVLAGLVLGVGLPLFSADKGRGPNIVLIECQDVGYGDLGAYGGRRGVTPNCDRLARDGMTFQAFYSANSAGGYAPQAAVLYGVFVDAIQAQDGRSAWLDRYNPSIAMLMQERGYRTLLCGESRFFDVTNSPPLRFGFDHFSGIGRRQPRGAQPIYRAFEVVDKASLNDLADIYTDAALEFIQSSQDVPFFVYLSHTMAKPPLGVPDRFRRLTGDDLYSAVLANIDWNLGRILDALAKRGLQDRTVIIFFSTNGPDRRAEDDAGSTGPFTGGKYTVKEGGLRVPCLVQWPDVVQAGAVCDVPVVAPDVFATLATLIGKGSPRGVLDGQSLLPLLEGNPKAFRPHNVVPYYRGGDLLALRHENWKLVFPHTYPTVIGRDGRTGTGEVRKLELYDLQNDEPEVNDLADAHREVVRDLNRLANEFRSRLSDPRRVQK